LVVGTGDAVALIAGALQGEKVPQGGAAQLQQAMPDAAFDVVNGRPFGNGGAGVGKQLVGKVAEQLGVVDTCVLCEHGPRPPGQGERGVVTTHVVLQEALVVEGKRRNCLLSHGLPKSGRSVTPEPLKRAAGRAGRYAK